ncbi:MAG: DinB family protein [Bacteroidota bacterium]|nr:DinB family protein [Bacteroidota bacterium]MDP4230190.1 DinB family protein [Bacteroidota bacterium]MDP4237159.1 DinB family protein [Bacteroidota bacterium]
MSDHLIIAPPKPQEYPASFEQYIKLVPSKDLLSYFESQKESVASIAVNLSEEQLLYRYAEGKWSIKDICSHVIDCERVYNYRALCIARGDKMDLPAFDENEYARQAHADLRDIADIISEYRAVRASTIELYKSFTADMLDRMGSADSRKRSVRSMGYIAAGHELHHISVIKEKYLKH